MRLPVIQGLIKRRLLVNFRVDAATIRSFLPKPFRPKLHRGHAIAGVCLIRLEQIRPTGFPAMVGVSSENAAHRIAVEWDDPSGEPREGVFIPRRDTSSLVNHFAGGRLFPGEHHLAKFRITDNGGHVNFTMRSRDGAASVSIRGSDCDAIPPSSCFDSLSESSAFFKCGSLGYSVTRDPRRLDGLRLQTLDWRVRALSVESVESNFFANRTIFPNGSVQFDHALVMRDIPHEWHHTPDMITEPTDREVAVR